MASRMRAFFVNVARLDNGKSEGDSNKAGDEFHDTVTNVGSALGVVSSLKVQRKAQQRGVLILWERRLPRSTLSVGDVE